MFRPFLNAVTIYRKEGSQCPPHLAATVTSHGVIHCHPTRRLAATQWSWVLAHCLLHLGLGHHREHADMNSWNQACDEAVGRLLSSIKLGEPPPEYAEVPNGVAGEENKRYAELLARSHFQEVPRDLIFDCGRTSKDFSEMLAHGIRLAVDEAVARAAGVAPEKRRVTQITQARDWFMASYPLLGSLAASFELVEDAEVCRALDIQVAAVDEWEGKIYFNPALKLTPEEVRFVMAHEFLHAGLTHGARCQHRHAYLWNVACDFVINDWLMEMGVGEPPSLGLLYDPELKGKSAEEVYEIIACEARRFSKRGTFRGIGRGDILHPRPDDKNWSDLDDFYRRCLSRGFELHRSCGRGLLPAGLVEAIRALEQPPIPWDVELAHWFDRYFPPIDRLRSYARPSRRQQACPDLPRPSRYLPGGQLDARTFGVVLDTSGSMDSNILGKALGAIAAYASSRDVPLVRLVCCDAAAYDLGYLPAEAIADRLRLRGRGGTVLQPGLDRLHAATDFPPKGPILVITDAYCDRFSVPPGRPHAFLLPPQGHLPFIPRGPVFRISH